MQIVYWFLAALIFFVAVESHAEPQLGQETLEYCMNRGKLAVQIVQDVRKGFTLEQINMGWRTKPDSPQDAVDRDMWVEALKDEIRAAMLQVPETAAEYAQLVGQKVAEKCAYEYGASKARKTPVHFIKTASSQQFKDGANARFDQCSERLSDQVYIGNMLARHSSADELREIALKSNLGPARFDKVMKLIDEAEKAQDVQAWFDGYWKPCLAGQ